MVNSIAATTLQTWLTRQGDRAADWLLKGEPETPQFKAGMERIWEAMELFKAVESSLRRAGYEGCIRPETGCAAYMVSCLYCAHNGRTATAAAKE